MVLEAVGNLRRVLSTPALRRNAAVTLRGIDETAITVLIDAVRFGEAPRELAPEFPVQLGQSAAAFLQVAGTVRKVTSGLTRPHQNIFGMRSVHTSNSAAASGSASANTELGDFLLLSSWRGHNKMSVVPTFLRWQAA